MDDVLVCDPEPTSARRARTYVVDHLQEWGLDHLVDSAALMTSELATNALTHTGQPFRVRILRRRAAVRVEVEDTSPVLPHVRETTPVDEIDLDRIGDLSVEVAANDLFSGLGMVDAVATAWGSERVDDGKIVWFELSTSSAFEEDRTRASLRDPHPQDEDIGLLAPTGFQDLDDARRPVWLPVGMTVLAVVTVIAVVWLGLWAGGVIGAVWY